MLIRRIIRRILAAIREWLCTSYEPVKLSIQIRREIVAWEFNISISRTGNEALDIVRGEMTVDTTVAGEPRTVTLVVAPDATSAGPFYGSEGTEGSASFVWIDDAGNMSPATTLTFTITDTEAPGASGELGVEMVREIPDDQVPPVA